MSEKEIKESLTAQLRKLRSSTLMLLVFVFSVIGVLIGYYISGDIFTRPFNDVQVNVLGESTVNVKFETAFPAKTKIMYGTSDLVMNEMEISNKYSQMHEINLNNLLPDRPHVIKLFAEETSGREHMSPLYKVE